MCQQILALVIGAAMAQQDPFTPTTDRTQCERRPLELCKTRPGCAFPVHIVNQCAVSARHEPALLGAGGAAAPRQTRPCAHLLMSVSLFAKGDGNSTQLGGWLQGLNNNDKVTNDECTALRTVPGMWG